MQTSNIISPCSRLNDNVLREIFIHCVIHPGHAQADTHTLSYRKSISNQIRVVGNACYYKTPIREQPQLSVSRVCSSWRNTALLTPQLWDNIHISYLNDAILGTAREYLSRAKNLPLAISIERTDKRLELPWQDWCPQLTNFLSSYRIRILHLDLRAGKMPLSHLILPDLPQRSVADLETLIVEHRDHEEEIDLNDNRYPKLDHVRIVGAYKSSGFSSSSLRIFDDMLLSMTVMESWDLLSHCPSLEVSQLNIIQANGSRMPSSMPQIHPRCLRVLGLLSESEITFSAFIEVLTLPVVEQLHVARGWSATAFRSLAHRSNYFPHLRNFNLKDPTTSIVDAGALLALMPCLTGMHLPDSSPIIDRIALDGLASGSLAPRLQILIVEYISNMGPFLDMAESRMQNAQMSSDGVPVPFIKVVLFEYNQDYMDRLLDMWQRGIPIAVWE
ncbi:hypothetical protein M378DRAFT_16742 [Amanita muscaria Koide BX008]|uniref:F-box domain-containing protein n=1 Tax=Amanita muscaria (strain Koide BX008) TaxID=946122 RepID=A0A0C2WKW1_AMAMK|nr:hypothetical protein M378DRAFT_16742 [Amanita muscaria Koide BX008]